MRSRSLRFTLVLTLALGACAGDDDGSGGDGSSAFESFKACGGDPVGTWKVEMVDFDDPAVFAGGLHDEPACKQAVGDVRVDPEGSYTFGKDKSYKVDASFSVEMKLTLDEKCLQAIVQAAVMVDDSACAMLEQEFVSAGYTGSCKAKSEACACSITTPAITVSSDSTYTVKGDQLVVVRASGDGTQSSDFCVSGDQLEVKVESAEAVGVFVLER
jgi:hypothetical protein